MAELSPQNVTTVAQNAPTTRGVAGRLAQSFAIYGLANFGIRALNFLLIVVYAHYLRPSDYGIIYLAEIVAAFLVIFESLAIDSALQRLYFQHNHDPEELRSFIGTVVRFGLLWMALLAVLVCFTGGRIQSHFPHISVPFYPYVAMAIVTATATLGVQVRLAIYKAARRPRSYAMLSIFLFVLTAAGCICGVIVLGRGALGMLEGKLVAALFVFVVSLWSLRTFFTAPFAWKFVREALSFGLPLVPHLMMASGLIVADRFILEHYRNLGEVGIYSLAYTLGMVMFLVTQSLSQAWLPMFYELAGSQENRPVLGRICSGLLIFLFAIGCSGMLVSPLFVHLALDARYHAADRIVPLVIAGYLCHAIFSLFSLSILQAKRTSFVFSVSLVAFTANIVLNFIMIPRWGMEGAAWATTLAYVIEAVGAYFLAQRFFPLPYRLLEILAGFAISGAVLWLTQSPWMLRWHGLLTIASLVAALGLLALVGRRDLQMVLWRARKGGKREPLGIA